MGKDNANIIEIKENRKELEEIATIAQKVLDSERNIAISHAKAIPTIAYEYILALMNYLSKNKSVDKDTVINCMGLFDIGVTYRKDEDGEKDGNFVPFINAGQIFKTAVKSDEDTEDDE